jgi:hypothetical protein
MAKLLDSLGAGAELLLDTGELAGLGAELQEEVLVGLLQALVVALELLLGGLELDDALVEVVEGPGEVGLPGDALLDHGLDFGQGAHDARLQSWQLYLLRVRA